jgi:hypothetical protein
LNIEPLSSFLPKVWKINIKDLSLYFESMNEVIANDKIIKIQYGKPQKERKYVAVASGNKEINDSLKGYN